MGGYLGVLSKVWGSDSDRLSFIDYSWGLVRDNVARNVKWGVVS